MTEYQRQWRKDNPDKIKAANARYRMKLKLDVLTHYAQGKPECYCCGEETIHFLGLDHMDNDGVEERKITGGGHAAYRWLKTNGYPERNYKIACQNCNSARYYYGECPHQGLPKAMKDLRKAQKPLDPEISRLISEHFWELV